nr:immunoglobulin heavy chain junction region [Mus musculus]MBK4184479.1 immunoglobulin heavy chain junction region [Mus musculus]
CARWDYDLYWYFDVW